MTVRTLIAVPVASDEQPTRRFVLADDEDAETIMSRVAALRDAHPLPPSTRHGLQLSRMRSASL